MAGLPLNKATLTRKKRDLATYRQYLPSLDLKRKQLLMERARARDGLATLEDRKAALFERIGPDLPMLANLRVEVEALVRVAALRIGEENVVGVRVPVLDALELQVARYGFLARPHWVDRVVERWQDATRLTVEARIGRARLDRIEAALTTVTQRVNLFEKVLIPRTEAEIAKIEIALQDAERAGVIRAKVAKRMAKARAS